MALPLSIAQATKGATKKSAKKGSRKRPKGKGKK